MPNRFCIWLVMVAALLFVASPAATAEKDKGKEKALESSCVAPAKGPASQKLSTSWKLPLFCSSEVSSTTTVRGMAGARQP